MGSVGVSSCRCCVFVSVSVMHPVAILSAVFCVMFMSDASGGHMVETYSSMGLVMACVNRFPHVVDVSNLSICIVLRAFVVVIYMCLLYVILSSRVSPSIFGLMFMGSVMVSICSSSFVLYSAGFGVKRVHVVLSGLRMRLVVCVHVCISCRYDWMRAFAVFMSLCVNVVCVGREFYRLLWCWSVRCVYVENVGDRTPHCGIPVLNWPCVDILFLNVVYALRPLM